MRIVVSGGNGEAGRFIIPELVRHGHEVVSADITCTGESEVEFHQVDLADYDQTLALLRGADAVIHMARITNAAPEVTFYSHVMFTWNVLQAADALGIPKVILASSINAVGATWSRSIVSPLYFPIDEEHPTRAEDAYSLGKCVGEQIADGFARRRQVQIASLRFHGLWDDERMVSLRQNDVKDPLTGAKGFWGYLHLKDCARACRMAVEATWEGHKAFFLNAADTTLDIPTKEAIHKWYPGAPLRKDIPGFTSPIDISRARLIFGWEPEISWRGTSQRT